MGISNLARSSAAPRGLAGVAYQMAAAPDGSGRRLVYVDERCRDLIGIEARALTETLGTLLALTIPEHRDYVDGLVSQALRTGSPLAFECAIRRPDVGDERWLRITTAPRPGHEALADGWTLWDGLIIDITELKRAEGELEAQRHRLDLAVEAAGLGFFDYDIRQDRSTWSDRTRALYGMAPDAEHTFQGWFEDAIHPEDRAALSAAYEAALTSVSGRFSAEQRAVLPPGPVRWLLVHGQVLRDEHGARSVVGTVQDITERRASEERTRLVTRELAHRAKNGLSLMLAIIGQTARGATTVPEFEAKITSRILAMSRSQDLVTEGGGPLDLLDLLQVCLEPFDAARVSIDPSLGEVRLAGTMSMALSLLLHEMATNATKYGALSVPSGRVAITRRSAGPGLVTLGWHEFGGPKVVPPAREGFGSKLFRAALRLQGGLVETRFPEDGFSAQLVFPVLTASEAGESRS